MGAAATAGALSNTLANAFFGLNAAAFLGLRKGEQNRTRLVLRAPQYANT